jgi:hypothetical protein
MESLSLAISSVPKESYVCFDGVSQMVSRGVPWWICEWRGTCRVSHELELNVLDR